LVATSGNVSGEPVLFDDDEARTRLSEVADAFLHHDRRIARPADDSIVRVVRSRARVLRLGRGLAPCEMTLPQPVSVPVLAVGGHLKTTVALAWGDRAVISPHIGDMGTVRSEQVFAQVVADLQRLHGVRAEAVVCDAHPGYATTRWARECGLPVTTVQHHRAHASALAAEGGIKRPALIFAWDGAGFGDDGTLWGGETFFGRPGDWRRVASLRQFRLPGGEGAGRAPWRSAAALCWEAGIEWLDNPAPPLALDAWRRKVNAPVSSAVGRLFDAAAAIVLGIHDTTFEGQGPMWLETHAKAGANEETALPIHEQAGEILRIDWAPLVAAITDKRVSIDMRATKFHLTLARTIAEVARHLRAELAFDTVGLTGGVFQNRVLTQFAADELERAGFEVCLSERIPCNDGGLAFGQLAEVSARLQAPERGAG
jgi:hydrogenase maturation protein HypF